MNMKKELLELVKIVAPVTKEKPVRDYLFTKLIGLVDGFKVDEKGNILAHAKCGTGEGATVLLSAHMDTVNGLDPDRQIVYDKNMDTVYSTKGILGADDRAGIAIILSVLRNMPKTFNGTLKVAFSVEEEWGCIGANLIAKDWLKGIDLAIVVDRKGSRDIVTGTWTMPFCDPKIGTFFEGLYPDLEWKACDGGISDAYAFANKGVNSVNLSAGYYDEHTSKERVVIGQMCDTRDLILKALTEVNSHYKEWGAVPVPEYQYKKQSYNKGYDDVVHDDYGDIGVRVSKSGNVVLTRGKSVLTLSERGALDLAESLYSMAYDLERGASV